MGSILVSSSKTNLAPLRRKEGIDKKMEKTITNNIANDTTETNEFVAYEYLSVKVKNEDKAMFHDAYENFGWQPVEETISYASVGSVCLRFKRNRKIANKSELLKLQREMEQTLSLMEGLKNASNKIPMQIAYAVGGIATIPMALATFGVLDYLGSFGKSLLFIIPLALIGFCGWIAPIFLHKKLKKSISTKNLPLIEEKYEELEQICRKANVLTK